MGFVEAKKLQEQKQASFIRRLMASASARREDDAAQVADLEAQIARMQIALQAAKSRLARSEAGLAELQAMWVDLE